MNLNLLQVLSAALEHHHEHEAVKELAADIGCLDSLIGGFLSFFSIWQFCIAQISPFFMAFILGVRLITDASTLKKSAANLLIPSIGYSAGFSIIFALLGSSGTYTGSYLLYNIKYFRLLSGIFILFTGVFIAGTGFLIKVITPPTNAIVWLLAPLLGVAFAFVYSPCIPPVLSKLLNYASIPENAVNGLLLLTVYGMGLSSAFVAAGIPFAMAVGWQADKGRRPGLIILGSAFFLMALGAMNITGLMVYYKAFLLGFFVE